MAPLQTGSDVMNLRQLRCFVLAADTGSLSRAALILDLTQSGLSRQIMALEGALGIRLFERTGHGVVPTEAGEALIAPARLLLAEERKLDRMARDMVGGAAGAVTLAATSTVAQSVTTPVLGEIVARHPAIRLTVIEGSGARLSEWLADGTADLAMSYAPPEQFHGALDGEKLITDAMCLIGPPGWQPDADAGRFETLGRHPLVLAPRRSGLRRRIDALAAEHGMNLSIVAEVDSPATVLAAVQKGMVYTLGPWAAFASEARHRGLVMVPVDEEKLRCWLSLYVARARGSNMAVRTVASIIRKHSKSLTRT
jgi:LysR family nitrogen assimilation transcriptional regulator